MRPMLFACLLAQLPLLPLFAQSGNIVKNQGITSPMHQANIGNTIAGKSYETFYCTGNGGNKIFVFKDQPWVVVITASAYGASYAHPQADKIMQEYILPALIN